MTTGAELMRVVYGAVHGVWDYGGVAEVAEYLGVTKQCLANWTVRGKEFPEPVAKLSMGQIWHMTDVRDWARLNKKGIYDGKKNDGKHRIVETEEG